MVCWLPSTPGKLPVYQLWACQQVLLQLFRTIRGDLSKSTETAGPINKASMILSATEMKVFLINPLRTCAARYFKASHQCLKFYQLYTCEIISSSMTDGIKIPEMT